MQQPPVGAKVRLHVGEPQEREHERVEELAGRLAPRGERDQGLAVLQGPPGLPEEEEALRREEERSKQLERGLRAFTRTRRLVDADAGPPPPGASSWADEEPHEDGEAAPKGGERRAAA